MIIRYIKTLIRKKLHSSNGESITETLVALLISSLALVMLAGAINASSRIVNNARDKLKDYYDANDMIAEMVSSPPSGSGVTRSTITIDIYGGKADGTDSALIASESVISYENGVFDNKKVKSYILNK